MEDDEHAWETERAWEKNVHGRRMCMGDVHAWEMNLYGSAMVSFSTKNCQYRIMMWNTDPALFLTKHTNWVHAKWPMRTMYQAP